MCDILKVCFHFEVQESIKWNEIKKTKKTFLKFKLLEEHDNSENLVKNSQFAC